jgi:Uma2 family endonuclease
MSIADAWPTPGKPFTVAELDRMPDDARRYEIVAGALVVTQQPASAHRTALTLASILDEACPSDRQVIPAPAVIVSSDIEFVPDIVVIGHDELRGAKITKPPLLVVEVCSSSALILDAKKAVYERFGVELLWVLVPHLDKPEVIVFELHDGRYQEAAHVTGDQTLVAARPFCIEVVPSRLVAGLQPRVR